MILPNYIVQLEEGVWISSFGRTLVFKSAKQYGSRHGARVALGMYRKRHNLKFENAQIFIRGIDE